MTVVDAPKSQSFKDKLIFDSNREAESIFTPQGTKSRKNRLNMFWDLKTKKFSKEELEELWPLFFQRLSLLVRIHWDEKAVHTIVPEIVQLQNILAYRELIKDNTRAINLSFETFSLRQDEPVQKEHTRCVLEALVGLFEAVNPQSITDLRWEMGSVGLQRAYSYIFDPKKFYARHSRKLLQIVSTFTNLVNFQYISRDSQSVFEKVVSQTISCLPNLEVIVISRGEKDVKHWYDRDYNRLYDAKMSKLMGKTLSSLTKLKRLHLQGLVSPRKGWSKLDWKCPLEYLKVAECPNLHGEVIFVFAHAFRKTLLGLMIGPPPSWFNLRQPKMEFGKDFEVLEELSVRSYLGIDKSLADDMSQAPKLKHFDIHQTHHDILADIKSQIEGPEPAWPSLQTLGLDADRVEIYNGVEELEKSSLDAGLKDVTESISHKFGMLDAEWDWEREVRDDHKVNYKYGTMTLSNGRVIEVKGLDVHADDRISCKYVDTAKLISQLSS